MKEPSACSQTTQPSSPLLSGTVLSLLRVSATDSNNLNKPLSSYVLIRYVYSVKVSIIQYTTLNIARNKTVTVTSFVKH